uniref:Uncharacterized protein n=1 Tax=Oryza nivara TaxID=4536 RepID=A0A0E0IPK6_ORYNI
MPFYTTNTHRNGGTHRQNTHTKVTERERHAPFWPENLGVRREHVRSAAGDVGRSASTSGEEARGGGDDRRSISSCMHNTATRRVSGAARHAGDSILSACRRHCRPEIASLPLIRDVGRR